MSRAIACVLFLLTACGEPPPPAPTVALARVIRGDFQLEREGHSVPVRGPARVELNAAAITGSDGRGSMRLDNGGWVLLDHDTHVVVTLEQLTLSAGKLWLDVTDAEETSVETEHGSVSAKGATMAVDVVDGQVEVYCGSGEVTYHSPNGEGRFAQGETLILEPSAARVEPAELWEDWTGGLADPTPRHIQGPSYVGVLAGRTLQQLGQARAPLPIRGHEVHAVVRGDLAETEVVQTFFNARSDTLEAEYKIRVPEDAIVQGFAVDTGNGFLQGQVGTIATSSGYEVAWGGADTQTARLGYDGPNRYRARIFPINPGATVRVRVRYTQWMERRGHVRTYHYPMTSGSTAALIGEFVLEVDATGGAAAAYRAGMGARVENGRIVLRRSDFRPHSDFYLDLIDPEDRDDDLARAYVVHRPPSGGADGDEKFVLLDVPTAFLGRGDPDEAPLEMVLVVDVSGSTEPEDLELARGVIESVLEQLTPQDRVTLRVADLTAHVPAGGPDELSEADEETREAILESLARAHTGGATDLGASLLDAAHIVAGRPRGTVLYLGDGIPTAGALDATSLRQVLSTLDAPARFFALAMGDGANVDLLRALFGEQTALVRERTEASRAVMGILAEAARPMLRGVSVDLGAAVERIFPRPPLDVPVGASLRIVGRVVDRLPEQLTLRGMADGQPFEETLGLLQLQIQDGGDIRRRWAAGRLGELLDRDAGKEALAELGVRFGLITPWTSFVVGAVPGNEYVATRGFDRDPTEHAWSLGGRGPGITLDSLGSNAGWRRRSRRGRRQPASAPERTWTSRVAAVAAATAGVGRGDGGLAAAAVMRALRLGQRGPQGCFERKLTTRPDLQGTVTVRVQVDGTGRVRRVDKTSSTLGAADVDLCVVNEVRGIRFPATGATVITTATHAFVFRVPDRTMGTRRRCSAASRQPIEVRRDLWRERLAANAGVRGALGVWREAGQQCELSSWRVRRTLLNMMLRHVGPVARQVQLYRAFGAGSSVAPYLRRRILQNVRTPRDVMAVRAGLGLDVPVDWRVFARLWRSNHSAAFRLRLVRRWLDVVPEEMDLRLRLLSLLEQTDAVPEAKRLARTLRADPLADARARTMIGEFWLRQNDAGEARRVFSEIVEVTPLDPWARHRLGDLYRAHGWFDDAYREYMTLARLRPSDRSVTLALARAAAGAGRLDEALRLEQRISEATDARARAGVAAAARLWTQARLARLRLAAADDEALRESVRERERSSGTLRDPPAIFAAFTWEHPDDRPELFVRYPSSTDGDRWSRASLGGGQYGVEAVRIEEREEGDYFLEVRRREADRIRDVTGELLVVIAPGTAEQRVLRQAVTLTRQAQKQRLRLHGAELTAVPIPAAERRVGLRR